MRTETEKKPTREMLEISLNAHLDTAEHKHVKLRAINYIQKIWSDIFIMHDADAQQMLGEKKRSKGNLQIFNTEIFANSCIHLWKWKNDGLVSPAYQLVILITQEQKYYAWQRLSSLNRDGIPFSDQELPLGRYTLRFDGKSENNIDICEELAIDENNVVWRNGNKIVCHECSYQAHEEKNQYHETHYFCSTNCSRCHEGQDEIRRACSIGGFCLGNAGWTVQDGSLNMRLVENVEDVIQELENEF